MLQEILIYDLLTALKGEVFGYNSKLVLVTRDRDFEILRSRAAGDLEIEFVG